LSGNVKQQQQQKLLHWHFKQLQRFYPMSHLLNYVALYL